MKYYEIWINDTTFSGVPCLDDWDAWNFAILATNGQKSKVKVIRL